MPLSSYQFDMEDAIIHASYERTYCESVFILPEWRNVELAEEITLHLESRRSIWHYPYFDRVGSLWRLLAVSFEQAWTRHSFLEVLTCENMMINLFVTIMTTLEFTVKGLVSFPMKFFPDHNDTAFQAKLTQEAKNYQSLIYDIPFYKYPFWPRTKSLLNDFIESNHKSYYDYLSFAFVATDYILKAPVGKLITSIYEATDNQSPLYTYAVVSSQCRSMDDQALLAKNLATKIDLHHEGNKILSTYYDHSSGKHYFFVKLPRYVAFKKAIFNLFADKEFTLEELAGQKTILVKLKTVSKSEVTEQYNLKVVTSYRSNDSKHHDYMVAEVPVDTTLKELVLMNRHQIKDIYDF